MIFDKDEDFAAVLRVIRAAETDGFIYRVGDPGIGDLKRAAMHPESIDRFDRVRLQRSYDALIRHPEARLAYQRFIGNDRAARETLETLPPPSEPSVEKGEAGSSRPATPSTSEVDTMPPPASSPPQNAGSPSLFSADAIQLRVRSIGPGVSKFAREAAALSSNHEYSDFVHAHFNRILVDLIRISGTAKSASEGFRQEAADFIEKVVSHVEGARELISADGTSLKKLLEADMLSDLAYAAIRSRGDASARWRIGELSSLLGSAVQSEEMLLAARAHILEAWLFTRAPLPPAEETQDVGQMPAVPRDQMPTMTGEEPVPASLPREQQPTLPDLDAGSPMPIGPKQVRRGRIDPHEIIKALDLGKEMLQRFGRNFAGEHAAKRLNQLQRILTSGFERQSIVEVFSWIVTDLETIRRVEIVLSTIVRQPDMQPRIEGPESAAVRMLIMAVREELAVAFARAGKGGMHADLQKLRALYIGMTDDFAALRKEPARFDALIEKLMHCHIGAMRILAPYDIPPPANPGNGYGGGGAGPKPSSGDDPEIIIEYPSGETDAGRDAGASDAAGADGWEASVVEYLDDPCLDAAGEPAAQFALSALSVH